MGAALPTDLPLPFDPSAARGTSAPVGRDVAGLVGDRDNWAPSDADLTLLAFTVSRRGNAGTGIVRLPPVPACSAVPRWLQSPRVAESPFARIAGPQGRWRSGFSQAAAAKHAI